MTATRTSWSPMAATGGDDPYVVNSAALDGDRLTLEVSYAGGWRDHAFTLVISASFRESDLLYEFDG